MNDDEKSLRELGRRAVACPRWRWMPGMRSFVGPGRAPYRYITNEYAPPEGEGVGFSDPIVPDLSDPATLGCMLALVQEAWNACRISLCFSAVTPNQERSWAIPVSYLTERDGIKNESFYGRTHGEALVAALEAAP